MSELTKEYLDQKLEEKFDEFAVIMAKSFSVTTTKDELAEHANGLRAEMNKGFSEINFQMSQLTAQVKEFVETVKKQDTEYVALKVKYHELEKRVIQLETRFGGAEV